MTSTGAGLVAMALRDQPRSSDAGITPDLALFLDERLGHGIVKARFYRRRTGWRYRALVLVFDNNERWEMTLGGNLLGEDFAFINWGYTGEHEKWPFAYTYHGHYALPPVGLDEAAIKAWRAQRNRSDMLRDFVLADNAERRRMSTAGGYQSMTDGDESHE